MAASDWVEIYQAYSDEELTKEIADLKKLAVPFTGQTVGSKSYEKDLREVRDRLQAAIRVLNARGGAGASEADWTAVADFGGVQV
jgi:hypothetical protein